MEYYPRFLGAILQTGAGPYVLLSRPPLNSNLAVRTSLDLHISGTPPTFILSQDQTLKKNIGKSRQKSGLLTRLLNKTLFVKVRKLSRVIFYSREK